MNTEQTFWSSLLKWFANHQRDFPWRKTAEPFYILIAEFLLQQTNVRKVQPIYEELVSRYPTPDRFVRASQHDVENIIQPLGLKYRATRLKKCAEIIQNQYYGFVPNKYDDLLALPGVGPYIADAVLCYAFNHPTIPIDTNVIRVFCRFFGLASSRKRSRTDALLTENIRKFYKFENTRIPNLAVIDFAGMICTARKPRCKDCPIPWNCTFFTVP